jgi:hypothetical protein
VQILQGTGIDTAKRKERSKLCMNQDVTVRLDQGETTSIKIGRVRQGCCLSHIQFILDSEYFIKVAHGELGGQVILTVNCADDLELLTEEEMVTQDIINKLINCMFC